MENMYYIGLDVHKKTISYCVKDGGGRIYAEAEIPATRLGLDMWMKTLPQPWTAAMEATIFTAWIYVFVIAGYEGGAYLNDREFAPLL